MKRKIALFTAMIMLISSLVSACAPKVKLDQEPPKSLKVLAIGGSFSMDAMEFLYGIATDGGVEEVVLGNLFLGGGSLEQHVENARGDLPNYTYYKNSTGDWESTENYTIADAIADEDWDYISLQQTSALSGLKEPYEKDLANLIACVREVNTEAELIWHMTWSYAADCEEEAFADYNNDQMTMYEMIVERIDDCISKEEELKMVIPCGTAIQNARTSYLGDTLNRDGFHLTRQVGRYIAGMAWFAALTKAPVGNITYNPFPGLITDEVIAVAKEAATNAVQNPYEVTESVYTEGEDKK